MTNDPTPFVSGIFVYRIKIVVEEICFYKTRSQTGRFDRHGHHNKIRYTDDDWGGEDLRQRGTPFVKIVLFVIQF